MRFNAHTQPKTIIKLRASNKKTDAANASGSAFVCCLQLQQISSLGKQNEVNTKATSAMLEFQQQQQKRNES